MATCSTTPRRLSSVVGSSSGSPRQARTTNVSTAGSVPVALPATFEPSSSQVRPWTAPGRPPGPGPGRGERRGLDPDLAHAGAVGLVRPAGLALLARTQVGAHQPEVGVLVEGVVLEHPQVAADGGGGVAGRHAVVGEGAGHPDVRGPGALAPRHGPVLVRVFGEGVADVGDLGRGQRVGGRRRRAGLADRGGAGASSSNRSTSISAWARSIHSVAVSDPRYHPAGAPWSDRAPPVPCSGRPTGGSRSGRGPRRATAGRAAPRGAPAGHPGR